MPFRSKAGQATAADGSCHATSQLILHPFTTVHGAPFQSGQVFVRVEVACTRQSREPSAALNSRDDRARPTHRTLPIHFLHIVVRYQGGRRARLLSALLFIAKANQSSLTPLAPPQTATLSTPTQTARKHLRTQECRQNTRVLYAARAASADTKSCRRWTKRRRYAQTSR